MVCVIGGNQLARSVLTLAVLLQLSYFGQSALPSCGSNPITSPCKFAPGVHSYKSLTINTEVFLETTSSSTQHFFNVSQTFDIQEGTILTLDYNKDSSSNPGTGVTGNPGSSGGSYGGRAGAASNTQLRASQAEAYGTAFAVVQPGSSGGGSSSSRGKGGGFLKINARKLIIDGIVLANGERAKQNSNNGGGSGGGVSINCFEIDGNGRVYASGGMGSGKGGGGGGGRISVAFEHGSFNGEAKAYGGKTGNIQEGTFSTFYNLAYFLCVYVCVSVFFYKYVGKFRYYRYPYHVRFVLSLMKYSPPEAYIV